MRTVISILLFFLLISTFAVYSQPVLLVSPNKSINVSLHQDEDNGSWYLRLSYFDGKTTIEAIPQVKLGLSRNDQDFSRELKFLRSSKPIFINEQYTAIHGKRRYRSNQANEVVVSFENPSKAKLNVIIRAYNDGVAFRYEFPEKGGSFPLPTN